MLYTTVGNLLDDRAVFGGSAGWGLWLSIAASVVLACGALWAAFGRCTRPRCGTTSAAPTPEGMS